MTNRILNKDLHQYVDKKVTLAGWVHIRRAQGKMIFLELRDRSGLIQGVILPQAKEAMAAAKDLRPEWVVKLSGVINRRPEKNINPEVPNGDIELEITDVEVLSRSETPPFEITEDTTKIGEETRMKYRYLDLRTKRMSENIRHRSELIHQARNYLITQGFVEIETPILSKSTPEGARDYVVPSRLEPGKFYALPQSPQQYKQLLMVAGMERYFQIARCFRDEDTRGDRQPEFTQLDIEMSFTTRDEIMELTESMLTEIIETLYPHKKITQKPWPRLTYQEAIDGYGTDRPDLRTDLNDPDELAFGWVIDFPLFEEELENGHYAPTHHMFTMPHRADIDKLDQDPSTVRSTQMDMVLNGFEVGGGSIRIHDPAIQRKIFTLIGFNDDHSSRFDHMLTAFTYGVPPHGGIAPGLDRLLMILQNETSIREVIAFPKTGEGRDPLMSAPSQLDPTQLVELNLQIQRRASK